MCKDELDSVPMKEFVAPVLNRLPNAKGKPRRAYANSHICPRWSMWAYMTYKQTNTHVAHGGQYGHTSTQNGPMRPTWAPWAQLPILDTHGANQLNIFICLICRKTFRKQIHK
jgi:hypothetical protein